MPMEAMKRDLKCSFVGIHPLFGNVDSFKSRKIVVCNGSGDCGGLMEGLEKAGAQIIEMDALEHDRLIGEIQGVTHFIGLSVKDYLKKYDREKLKSVSTLSFEYLLGLLDRMEKNNPEIFMEIQRHNRYARESRKNLLEKLKEKDREMDGG
jgi:prephenate dehydrogenase